MKAKQKRGRLLLAAGITIALLVMAVCYYTGLAVFMGSMQLSTNESTGRAKMERSAGFGHPQPGRFGHTVFYGA